MNGFDHHLRLRTRAGNTGELALTLTIDEGERICQVVKETGKVFQVGTQQRSGGRFRLAVAIARSGMLARPLKATCSIGGTPGGRPWEPSEPAAHLDWDFWLGQCPVVPYLQVPAFAVLAAEQLAGFRVVGDF
jgi:hypothetical protein